MMSTRAIAILKAYVKLVGGQARTGVVMAAALLAGCAATSHTAGPQVPAPYRQDPWDPQYPQSTCITTANYHIFTDLKDGETLEQIAQLMEGAHRQYEAIASPSGRRNVPLRCYVFSRRDEWAAFTARHAGEDAAVYLRINRGAYTVDDWFVSFWLGDRGTYATMAHEGWHQYLARHSVQRMVPALEEGIACTFENISWSDGLPRWNLRQSANRSVALRSAVQANALWSLNELVRLHAGEVIKLPRERIETFYAQSWALAMFLMHDNEYQAGLERYVRELGAGTAYRPAGFEQLGLDQWNPGMSAPQLEHYLGVRLADLNGRYQTYCREVARRAGE